MNASPKPNRSSKRAELLAACEQLVKDRTPLTYRSIAKQIGCDHEIVMCRVNRARAVGMFPYQIKLYAERQYTEKTMLAKLQDIASELQRASEPITYGTLIRRSGFSAKQVEKRVLAARRLGTWTWKIEEKRQQTNPDPTRPVKRDTDLASVPTPEQIAGIEARKREIKAKNLRELGILDGTDELDDPKIPGPPKAGRFKQMLSTQTFSDRQDSKLEGRSRRIYSARPIHHLRRQDEY